MQPGLIELLIVDLDGTLVDSFDDIARGVRTALGTLGISASPRVLALCRRGLPLEAYYREATSRDPGAESERASFARFVAAYRDFYSRNQHSTRVYPQVRDTLAALRRRHPGLRMAVGTSKRSDVARSVIDRTDLAGYFDLVQGSDNVAKKPDPALLRLIAQTLDVPLERSAMVGDTAADVGAARAAGCLSIAVTYGGYPRHELESLEPDRKPHHLIDRFSQLLELL